ncbi:complement C1q-like protein 4 [Mytilus californianus]|uniref:complement C1q-like protein 4 n=1 Tax=Mytilus californianus TaxID=6549 RepID=UPI002246FE23|nr:complement C1q-like protein 4 [Mytilus californianus]
MMVLLFIPVLLLCGQMVAVKGDCNQKLENGLFDDLIQMMLKIRGPVNSGRDHLPKGKDFPAFTAYRASRQSLSVNTVVKFDKVWTNNGNGYNPSSGVFTAPMAGLYHFAAVVMSTDGKTLFVRLFNNNAKITSSYITSTGYKTGTFDVVLTLEKGDKVSIKSGHNSQTIYSDSDNYCTFSGNLIAL